MFNCISPGPGYTPRAPPPTTRTHMIFLTLLPLLHMESEFNSDESGSRRWFWPYFYKKRHFLKKKMEKTIFGHWKRIKRPEMLKFGIQMLIYGNFSKKKFWVITVNFGVKMVIFLPKFARKYFHLAWPTYVWQPIPQKVYHLHC